MYLGLDTLTGRGRFQLSPVRPLARDPELGIGMLAGKDREGPYGEVKPFPVDEASHANGAKGSDRWRWNAVKDGKITLRKSRLG